MDFVQARLDRPDAGNIPRVEDVVKLALSTEDQLII